MRRSVVVALCWFLPALLLAQQKPKTFIKGKRMDVLKKGEVTEFSGGVTMTRGDDFMSADRMVKREKQGLTQAWGRVYMRRDDPVHGLRWEAWGDEALYDSNTSSGTLWGRGHAARGRRSSTAGDPASAPLGLEGDRLTFFRAPDDRAEARGAVYLDCRESTPSVRRTRAWADAGDYDGAARSIRLSGDYPASGGRAGERPALRGAPSGLPSVRVFQVEEGQTRDLLGETVTYFEERKRLVVDGGVRAFWEGRDAAR